MGTIKDIKLNNYCDAVNDKLSGMITKVHALREDVKKTYGPESEEFRKSERHLIELADIIDWKLQILTQACPFEWKGMDKDAESAVSVGPAGKALDKDFSGGYLGG